MSNPDPKPEDPRRGKLAGRAMVIGLLVLIAAYVVATFVR